MVASAIFPALEQRSDFVVIAQERDVQISWAVLKDEAQRQSAATFKKLMAQFANAQTTVRMRTAKGLGQLAQCQQAFGSFPLG
jgi:hypothetical protein